MKVLPTANSGRRAQPPRAGVCVRFPIKAGAGAACLAVTNTTHLELWDAAGVTKSGAIAPWAGSKWVSLQLEAKGAMTTAIEDGGSPQTVAVGETGGVGMVAVVSGRNRALFDNVMLDASASASAE